MRLKAFSARGVSGSPCRIRTPPRVKPRNESAARRSSPQRDPRRGHVGGRMRSALHSTKCDVSLRARGSEPRLSWVDSISARNPRVLVTFTTSVRTYRSMQLRPIARRPHDAARGAPRVVCSLPRFRRMPTVACETHDSQGQGERRGNRLKPRSLLFGSSLVLAASTPERPAGFRCRP